MATRHSHGTMKGAFGHAHFYDGFTRLFRRFYARVAAEVAAAGLAPGARVLDVGTGPGRLPLLIAGAAPGLRVEGLDLSPEMIEHARRRAQEHRAAARADGGVRAGPGLYRAEEKSG